LQQALFIEEWTTLVFITLKDNKMSSSNSNDRSQVVSDSFRDDSSSTTEDVGGVGKARPNLEAVDFAPKAFDSRVEKS
jgi:hypothetical protein